MSEENNKKSGKSGIRKTSLNRRLKVLLLTCFVPITLALIYFLFIINSVASRYESIVSNITKVNEYNITFKEDLDYIMYIVTVNADRASVLVDTEQPHRMINSAKETFTELLNSEKVWNRKRILSGIVHNLDTLEVHVTEIEQTANIVGMYDKNISCLELDIRVLTELIQDNIQEYISLESDRLESLQLRLRTEVTIILIVSIILLILVLIIAISSARKILKNITGGIEEILMVTRKAGKGDFSSRISSEEMDDELAELGSGYNQMVQKIDALVQDIKSEQLNLRLTEQKLLQAQINPHFLYNTLDNIMWLAEAGDNENVIMMVSALSDFFRTTLSKGRDFITIEEEESHIRSYLQIQQFRYQDILKYDIAISKDLYTYQILKLTLQPLVENALYHGIKNKRGMGHILVTGYKEGEDIYLSVEDNGIGLTPEQIAQIEKAMERDSEEKSSFGLYNVQQRIRLNYGNEYGIHIESVYGEKTVITVKIPALEREPES